MIGKRLCVRLLSVVAISFASLGMFAADKAVEKSISWTKLASGFANTPNFKITKVTFYEDRTEVDACVELKPGKKFTIQKRSYIEAGGVEYGIKDITVLTLSEYYTMPEVGKVSFVMTFAPMPSTTKVINFVEPYGWVIRNIHSIETQCEELSETHWRSETMGEWMIGFTHGKVIYQSKVWDVISFKEQKDKYDITARHDEQTISIKVGKAKIENPEAGYKARRLRSIAINGAKPVKCSMITISKMPDYPVKDLREGFKDNGYRMDDSVVFSGWLNNLPRQIIENSKRCYISYRNFITNEQESIPLTPDSLGLFRIKIPLANTTVVYSDLFDSTVLEPNEEYFLFYDFLTNQRMFMGSNVRLQNELLQHPLSIHTVSKYGKDGESLNIKDPMSLWAATDSVQAIERMQMDDLFDKCPNLSQRYIDYAKGANRIVHGSNMMNVVYSIKDRKLPEDYVRHLDKEVWRKLLTPYTIFSDNRSFVEDYFNYCHEMKRYHNPMEYTRNVLKHQTKYILDRKGAQLTDAEKAKVMSLADLVVEFQASLQAAGNDTAKYSALIKNFNSNDTVKFINELEKSIESELADEVKLYDYRMTLEALDSLGADNSLKQLMFARKLCDYIDHERQPLDSCVKALADEVLTLPFAINTVNSLNDKYIALKNIDISKSSSLKSNDDVAGISEGEKIMEKLLEPYKGKFVLLDVWGTWCSPCKRALSESQEEYKQLKPYDMVFLYLANHSPNESWQAVIKEYNVLGDNVAHYNLPQKQHEAVEKYLKVRHWPSYFLFDRNGKLLDVDVDPRNLGNFKKLMNELSKD